MNSTYTVKVQVEAGGAVTNLEEIDKAVASSNSNLLTMRKELKQIQSELLALEPGTEEFVRLSQKAGEVRDKMNDVSESINANAGPAVESLGNNFSLLTGKLSNLDFAGASESLKAMGGNISRIKFSDFTNGIKSIGSSLAAVGKALLTNPIFLIGTALAAAIAYSDELLTLVDGISSEDEKMLANQKEKAALSKQQLDFISEQENILKLQGKSEKEILQMKIEASKVAIADLEAQLETQKTMRQSQIDAAKRNKDILSGIIQFVTAPLQVILYTIDQIAKFAGFETNLRDTLNDAASSLLFNPDEVAAKADESIAETEKALNTLKNQQAGFQLSVNNIDKQAADERRKRAEDQKKKDEADAAERIKREKETADAIREARNEQMNEEERIAEAIYQAGLTQREKELQEIRDSYFEKITLADQFGIDATALIEEQRMKEAEINQKYADAEAEAEEKRREKERTENEKKKKEEEDLMNARISMAQNTLNIISSITDLFNSGSEKSSKRAFEINKKVAIAQALIQTYQSATAAYASQMTIPSPDAPARAAIAAGIAVVTGLANVAKIARTKFSSGAGGGGGGGASAPSPSGGGGGGAPRADGSPAPAFNPLNTQFLNNRPDQMTPARAYVLTSDVASGQEATEKINALTTL